MSALTLSFAPLTQYVMDDPALRFEQGGLILFAILILFLLFYALRDILLRTRSFWYQFFCIVIVTLLPIIGFLIYLLIRPARTVKQRELEAMILTLFASEVPEQLQAGEESDDAESSSDTVSSSIP